MGKTWFLLLRCTLCRTEKRWLLRYAFLFSPPPSLFYPPNNNASHAEQTGSDEAGFFCLTHSIFHSRIGNNLRQELRRYFVAMIIFSTIRGLKSWWWEGEKLRFPWVDKIGQCSAEICLRETERALKARLITRLKVISVIGGNLFLSLSLSSRKIPLKRWELDSLCIINKWGLSPSPHLAACRRCTQRFEENGVKSVEKEDFFLLLFQLSSK